MVTVQPTTRGGARTPFRARSSRRFYSGGGPFISVNIPRAWVRGTGVDGDTRLDRLESQRRVGTQRGAFDAVCPVQARAQTCSAPHALLVLCFADNGAWRPTAANWCRRACNWVRLASLTRRAPPRGEPARAFGKSEPGCGRAGGRAGGLPLLKVAVRGQGGPRAPHSGASGSVLRAADASSLGNGESELGRRARERSRGALGALCVSVAPLWHCPLPLSPPRVVGRLFGFLAHTGGGQQHPSSAASSPGQSSG